MNPPQSLLTSTPRAIPVYIRSGPSQKKLRADVGPIAVVHSASSTFVDLGSGFSITYGDGTGANGDYFNDSLSLGGVTLKSFEMGLALDSSTNYGLIGIGYDSNEGNVDTGGVAKHPGFVDALVSGGFISTTAYSLWLDDLRKPPRRGGCSIALTDDLCRS